MFSKKSGYLELNILHRLMTIKRHQRVISNSTEFPKSQERSPKSIGNRRTSPHQAKRHQCTGQQRHLFSFGTSSVFVPTRENKIDQVDCIFISWRRLRFLWQKQVWGYPCTCIHRRQTESKPTKSNHRYGIDNLADKVVMNIFGETKTEPIP